MLKAVAETLKRCEWSSQMPFANNSAVLAYFVIITGF
jgi:hypothetical protein